MSLRASIIVALGHGNTESMQTDLRVVYNELAQYRSRDVDVSLCPFNADWKARAWRLHQNGERGAKIIFVGHSYGCGWGLKRFARFLDDNARDVSLAFLIDPVIRWFQFLTPLNVISLTRWGEFKLPANVHRTYTWRQVNASPPGRYVRGDGDVQRLVYGSKDMLAKYARPDESQFVDATVTHETIDGLDEVREVIYDLVREELA